MNRRTTALVVFSLAAGWLLTTASPAAAYGGPGSILTGLGALSAVVFALVASLFGFLWFPLKRLATKLHVLRTKKESEISTR